MVCCKENVEKIISLESTFKFCVPCAYPPGICKILGELAFTINSLTGNVFEGFFQLSIFTVHILNAPFRTNKNFSSFL